ncbi:uncharacterized protein K441DRAFT_654003 [Cenococcum geophilum 1.58]|uniref:uncharacterized protein n=1 Tax=Cenococcum geophilum 1.58 TaxID=794803 RepID=UPI00358DE970|nr:hypothetical protein K441DRAFT_654003 [Cenococcum geophilum 1.58]
MPNPQKRKRTRFSTPLPVVAEDRDGHGQLETPQRSTIFVVLYFCQQEAIPYSLNKLKEHFNIPRSTASNVLRSKRAYYLQYLNKLDLRGAPR